SRYQWKQFQDMQSELEYKRRQISELKSDEKEGLVRMSATENSGEHSLLAKVYENKKREIEEDSLLYKDPIVQIEPVQGEIWPNSFIDLTVVFQPSKASKYVKNLYLDMSGRQDRIPLIVKGVGIGPKAKFDFDVLDVEVVFINSSHIYELLLQNKGGIDVHYSFVKSNTAFGSCFRFEPVEGVVDFAKSLPIKVYFEPDKLGQFLEDFYLQMRGSDETVKLTIRGNVVGPTFEFNHNIINFGVVSFGFPYEKKCLLKNTSEIYMDYWLSISPNLDEEISFHPAKSSSIPPGGTQEITVKILSKQQIKYNADLIVNVEGVGEDIYRVPITAESIIPNVILKDESIELGDCYLDFPYESEIILVNQTNLPARYNLVSEAEIEDNMYHFKAKSTSGIIQPDSSIALGFEVVYKQLGSIQFSLFIATMGQESHPLELLISAFACGPKVSVPITKVDFGKVNVLSPVHSTIQLINESLIPANFICDLGNPYSVFQVEPSRGCLLPNEKLDVAITAFLDDNLKFQDTLKVGIQNGSVTNVVLTAKGNGSTIVFDEDIKRISFNDIFTNKVARREFSLVNQGRRAQILTWTMEEVRGAMKDVVSKGSSLFSVIPNRFQVNPGEHKDVVIEAFSTVAIDNCKQMILCSSSIDKDPSKHLILATEVSATFVRPLVHLSTERIYFYSEQGVNSKPGVLSEPLVLKNVSSLPLVVSMTTASPFSILPYKSEYILLPKEEEKLKVCFDPNFIDTKESYEQSGKIFVAYKDHPQKDTIELMGKVCYPNISVSVSSLDLGCVEPAIEARKKFTITNTGVLPVEYDWSFEIEEDYEINPFDVLPLRGSLPPDESIDIEISFSTLKVGEFKSVAVCTINGGPVYNIPISVETSNASYEFDTKIVDFGKVLYLDVAERVLCLINNGRLPLPYKCYFPRNSTLPYRTLINPESGVLMPFKVQKFSVRFCPCLPDVINGYFLVQIANDEPVKIGIQGQGMFSFMRFNLPASNSNEYSGFMDEAKEILKREGLDEPEEQEIETEAIRLMAKMKVLEVTKNPDFQKSVNMHLTSFGKSLRKKNMTETSMEGLGLSNLNFIDYVCDFGNVIKGTSRKRVFKVTNHGPLPMSFSMDKSVLNGTNFVVEPDKVRALGSMESTEITISFVSKSTVEGKSEVKIPISIGNGTGVNLIIKANVAVPSIEVGTTELNFGDIMYGQRRRKSFELSNNHLVPCEWSCSLVYYEGSAKQRKRKNDASLSDFEIFPESGVLQPNENCEVSVQLTPSKPKRYEYELQLKIGNNPKPFVIPVTGLAYKSMIKIEPNNLKLPPVLPYSEGVSAMFSIENVTNHACEVVLLEFDKQYREEDEIMKKTGMFKDGPLYFPPRRLGEGLPQEIIDLLPVEKSMEN
ncbi:hypothetical protein ROZALSC1DRAFT_24102, partial [Rozella allomycis CSF55]